MYEYFPVEVSLSRNEKLLEEESYILFFVSFSVKISFTSFIP